MLNSSPVLKGEDVENPLVTAKAYEWQGSTWLVVLNDSVDGHAFRVDFSDFPLEIQSFRFGGPAFPVYGVCPGRVIYEPLWLAHCYTSNSDGPMTPYGIALSTDNLRVRDAIAVGQGAVYRMSRWLTEVQP